MGDRTPAARDLGKVAVRSSSVGCPKLQSIDENPGRKSNTLPARCSGGQIERILAALRDFPTCLSDFLFSGDLLLLRRPLVHYCRGLVRLTPMPLPDST